MNNNNKHTTSGIRYTQKAFTLLEVLIASTIFAGVMLITTGIVAQSSAYRSKLKTQREVSEETRMIADLITRDVRSANISGSVKDSTTTLSFKNGIALMNCSASRCDLVDYDQPSSIANANSLIIFSKDASGNIGYKFYIGYLKSDGNHMWYGTGTGSTFDVSVVSLSDANNAINNMINDTKIDFYGFAPSDAYTTQQPYVQFMITSKTWDYSNKPNSERAMAKLRSIVTSRSYNN